MQVQRDILFQQGELRKPSAATGAVAEVVGYQSEAAFQRAFKHYTAVTPAQWRRAQAAN